MSSNKGLCEMSYKELRTLAKEYNIPNFYKIKTTELYQALKQYEEQQKVQKQQELQNYKIEQKLREERNCTFRQQIHPNFNCLEEPFSFVREYQLKATKIPGEELSRPWDEDFSTFPNDIEHFFWVQEGQHDGDPWKCLVRIEDGWAGENHLGTFAYFEAGCDYTGFDCQGFIKVWVSGSYSSLIKFAMDELTYQTYIQETTPINVCDNSCKNCLFYGFPCQDCSHDLLDGKITCKGAC